MFRIAAWHAVVVVVGLTIGCGKGGVPVYGVSGKVTIDGEPAKNVQVTFMPTDATLPVASGNVDAAGNYVLVSGVDNRKGAAAGSYKVVLSQLESLEDAESRYSSGKGGPPPVPKASFPKEYASVETTPKQVDVLAKPNTIDLEIPGAK